MPPALSNAQFNRIVTETKDRESLERERRLRLNRMRSPQWGDWERQGGVAIELKEGWLKRLKCDKWQTDRVPDRRMR